MNALLALLVSIVALTGALGCAVIEEQAPAFDRAVDSAMRVGGCLKVKCTYPPVSCGPSVGSCRP
jgi:hypothetical protein